jgi:hypothetical protein
MAEDYNFAELRDVHYLYGVAEGNARKAERLHSLNETILNAALALLFYVCGHGFLFERCSTGNPQYAPEEWHQTLGTLVKKYI